jgi:hypothetical protein
MHATTLKTALLLVCVIGLAAGSAAAQPSFTDISSSCGIKYSGNSHRTWDVAIGDIHNNGRTDLYCMVHNQGPTAKNSIIYQSNSSLSLTNITSTVFGSVPATGGGQGAFLTDLNGDGYLDLMTGSNDGVGCVFRNRGDGTYEWYTDFPNYEGDWGAREISSGDMDGDGDQDIIYGIHHSNMRIARNDGNGVYTKSQISWINGETPCGATLPIVADMDNDGDLDIVSQYMSAFGDCPVSRTITVDFWQNNGSGVFTWVSDTHGLLGGEEKCALLVGDFDNDEDLDIIQLQNEPEGPNRYYVNDGDGYFTEMSESRGLGVGDDYPYTDWWCKGNVGDFDNDGDLDLAYYADIYSNDGSGNFTRSELNVSRTGRITGVGDLDGDGDLDQAGINVVKDGWWVYRNNTNDNRWLKVNVDAGPQNRFGVGSKVSVYDGSQRIGYRQVINSSAMQQPLKQHFGLGGAATVRVEVIFPDGSQTIVDNISAGQEITVFADGDPIKPSMPTGLSVTGTDIGCADLSWDTPDALENVHEYVVAFGPSPGTFTDSTTVSVTEIVSQGGKSYYSRCGLPDGRYCIAIRAHNRYGMWSAYTSQVCADVTNGETQPSVPQNVDVTQSGVGCATVSWDALGDPVVAGYWVYYSDQSVEGAQASEYDDSVDVGMATSREICNLAEGTYYFAVKSYTGGGVKSAYSQERSVVIDNRPPVPQNVSATESELGCASITWDAAGSPVTGYKVYYGDQSVADGQASEYDDSLDVGGDTSAEICAFSEGTYYFAVKSYTAAGDQSHYSVQRSVAMQGVDDTPPTVSAMNPADGATGVPLNTGIRFTVADDKAGVSQNSVTVTVNGTNVTNLGFVGTPASYNVVVTPDSDLPANSTVNVSVTISDLASPPNEHTEGWSFETGDVTIVDTDPPVFSGMSPADGATDVATDVRDIRVNVADDGMGVDMSTIEFYVNGGSVAYSTQGTSANLTLVYENTDGFAPNATVTVRVVASDLASPANQGERSFTFTVKSDFANVSPSDMGAIVPNGFWANDPTRPLEVRNLPVSWTVRIFDTAGRRIRDYTNNAADGADWAWDFNNDHGQRVARALYLVRVTDPNGKVQQSGNFLVQTDP